MLESLMILSAPVGAVAGGTPVAFPLQLRRAWPREVSRLGLQYVDAAGRVVPGQWHADEAETLALFGELRRRGAVLARSPACLVTLQPGGAENKLPALAGLLEREGAEIVAHRPGRRAVVRVADRGGVRYVKALRPSKVARILRANRFVSGLAARAFAVAELGEVDEAAGLLVMGEIGGMSLHGLAASDGEAFIAGCGTAGRALRSLHVDAPDWVDTHDASAEVAMLQERAAAVEAFVPGMHGAVARLSGRVFAALMGGGGASVVVHRDFYDKQVVVRDGGRPGLLDFDTLAAGEAALDVANMLGHLELRVLQGACSRATAAAAGRWFLEWYGENDAVTTRVPAYLDATRLRLAMLYAFWPKWAGLSGRLLEAIGSPPTGDSDAGLAPVAPARGAKRARASGGVRRAACPLVFVVGCPRSGTTMLERMLDVHPDLAMTHETHWVTKHARRRRDLTREGFVRPDTLDNLYADRRFARMAPDRAEIERVMEQGPLKYRRFVRLVFDHYRRARGKAFVGDKSTGGYLRAIERLRKVCPASKIVHLVRDGRDVCLSMLSWPKNARAAGRFAMFATDPVATTAAWWQWQVRAGMVQGRALGVGAYRELHYEDLVRETTAQCEALCAFLGLKPDAGMAAYHEGRSRPASGQSANAAWLAPTPGLRDWRTQMQDEQIEMFEAVAGETLAALGYERRFPRVSASVAALAAERVARWEREVGDGRESRSLDAVVVTTGNSVREGEHR